MIELNESYRNNLNAAVSEVVDYGASASSTSRKYGIPRTTLRRHIKRYREGDNRSFEPSDGFFPRNGSCVDNSIFYDAPEPSSEEPKYVFASDMTNWGDEPVKSSFKKPKSNVKFPSKRNQNMDAPLETTLMLFDVHIPHEDKEALDCAIAYAKKQYDITAIVLGGDIMDCEALSSFDKNKNTVSFSLEVEKTREFLDRLKQEFPYARITYLMGNHEERLEKYIRKNAPDLVDLGYGVENVLELEKRGIEFVDNRSLKATYNEFFKVGEFTILHGHEMGICPTISPAHKFLERAKGNLILGHIHSTDEKFTTCIDGAVVRCYSVGTLAKLNPMYRPFNSWCQGFAVIEHWQSHDIVKNYRIFDGKVY